MEIGADRGVELPDPVGENSSKVETPSFGELFQGMVAQAAGDGHAATTQALDFAHGRVDDLHGTMIAAKKAEISLKLVGSVRNKLLDSFHELWRMNV
jgi:flagellar hook-basal body complex protein FliE